MSINNSKNHGEYRKTINSLESNYLPKSGGTMTGVITRNGYLARSGSEDNILSLLSGTDVTHGSGLWLAGNNYSGTVPAGAFRLQGYNPSTQKYVNLTGKPDGTLTWNGSNVITSAGGTLTSLTTTNGANFNLGSNAGQVRLRTSSNSALLRNDGTDTYILLTNSGDPDGSWNTLRPFRINNSSGSVYINGNNVQSFVTSTYSSGTTWYRVWSDGFIEQCGRITATASALADKSYTFTLPKAMTTTTYYVSTIFVYTKSTGNWGAGGAGVVTKTTTQVTVMSDGINTSHPITGFDYYICGY